MSNNNKPVGKLEAEQSVIGSALLDHDALLYAVANLTADCFYGAWNKHLFQALVVLKDRNAQPDLVTVLDVCEDMYGAKHDGRTGGAAYIVEIQQQTPSSANHKEYVRIVAEYHAEQIGQSAFSIDPDRIDRTQALSLYELAHREERDGAREAKPHEWVIRKFPRLANVKALWPQPANADQGDYAYPKIDLVNAFWEGHTPNAPDRTVKDLRRTVLDEFSFAISEVMQFPVNTTFAFGLGAIASAMCRHFDYYLTNDKNGSKGPVTIYIVCAQPAGTGKSGVYKYFCEPIATSYENLNIVQKAKRAKCFAKLEGLKKELKAATNEVQEETIRIDIAKAQDELDRTPVYVYQVDDTTPEGLRDLAMAQNGLINIISDEADAVNTVLGAVYGDAGKKVNHGVFLKAWDGEQMSVARSGKDPMLTKVRGCIAIIAQDEAISSVLKAGLSGRGISERCMIMTEQSMIGYIDVRKRMESIMDARIRAKYANMITEIVNDEGRTFELTRAAMEVRIEYVQQLQTKIRPGGELSDPSLQGVLSKAEKQLIKIACVLHASHEWSGDGGKSVAIDDITMRRAIGIFDAMAKFYISAAEMHGYAGDAPKIERVHTYLDGQAQRKRMTVSMSQIRDAVKDHDSFAKAGTSVTQVLRESILPKMEAMGRLVVSECGSKVYLSLKEYGA